MLSVIITAIINGILKLIGIERQQSIKSENEALKGREESVEDSYAEQEKARKEAEKAKKDVENQSNSGDVFGADEWNKDENSTTDN